MEEEKPVRKACFDSPGSAVGGGGGGGKCRLTTVERGRYKAPKSGQGGDRSLVREPGAEMGGRQTKDQLPAISRGKLDSAINQDILKCISLYNLFLPEFIIDDRVKRRPE